MNGLMTRVQRLHQRSTLEADTVGIFSTPRLTIQSMIRTYWPKPPPAGSNPGRDSHLLVDRALRVQLSITVEAIETGNVMERDDAVARGRSPLRPSPGGNHCSSRLMTEDSRARQQVVLDLL